MKRCAAVLMIITLLLSTTGCWSRRELNELALVVGLAIDSAPNNQYDVMVQVVIPSQIATQGGAGGGGETKVTSFEARNNSIMEAFREMKTSSPRRLYFSHLRMLIIGHELAEAGLGEALEGLTRDPEFRSDFYVAIAKEYKASDYLKIMTPIENIPANKLFDSMELAQRIWSETNAITASEMINDMVNEGKEAAVTSLTMTGDKKKGETSENLQFIDPPTRMKFHGLTVFKKDKAVGFLTTDESRGYNYIINNVDSSVRSQSCQDAKSTWAFEVTDAKSKINTTIEGGMPVVTIDVEVTGDISEYLCLENINDPKTINKMEQINNMDLEEAIMKTVKKAQSLQSDIFGIGDKIHKQHPKAWKTLKPEWDEIFPDIQFEVHVSTTIQRTGTLNKSFLNDLKGND